MDKQPHVLLLVAAAGILAGWAAGISSIRHQQPTKNATQHTPLDHRWQVAQDSTGLDWTTFTHLGRCMVDYIVKYYHSIKDHRVRAKVIPGYLQRVLGEPHGLAAEPEPWQRIMADVDNAIMPGMTHWQHPRFFAYYPANSSPPALLGDMLAGMFNVVGFSWESSPAATELEVYVMDWLARIMGLPEQFLCSGPGGGVIQGTASEATLVAILAARERGLEKVRALHPGLSEQECFGRMTLYGSDQAHSSLEKGCRVAGLKGRLRILPAAAEDQYALSAEDLEGAIQEDVAKGLVPIFVLANVGTTSSCAIDPVREIGEVCQRHGAWLHVDAAYAGAAAICPEHKYLLDGLEGADSFNFNLHKWLLTNFECSAMWVRDRRPLFQALSLTPEYLRSKEHDTGLVMDLKDLQVPLGRKFRSLKVWFVLRAYGLTALQAHIRRHCALADSFASMVRSDDRFEVVSQPRLGLVCFRVKGADSLSMELRDRLVSSGFAFLVHTRLSGQYVLRLAVGSPLTEQSHVEETWDRMQTIVDDLLLNDHALSLRT